MVPEIFAFSCTKTARPDLKITTFNFVFDNWRKVSRGFAPELLIFLLHAYDESHQMKVAFEGGSFKRRELTSKVIKRVFSIGNAFEYNPW